MKEELSTKQHSEFSISKETEKKHQAWHALDWISEGYSIDEAIDLFDSSKEYIIKYKDQWEKLTSKKVVLKDL